MTTPNSFVSFVEQQHNTRGTSEAQGPAERGRGHPAARRIIWRVDAFLWLALCVNLALIGAESWFGVLSGMTMLMGTTPTLLLAMALIFGGAALILNQGPAAFAWMRTPRPAQTAPAFASDIPAADGFKVRTTPRSASAQRSRAARRVMEAPL